MKKRGRFIVIEGLDGAGSSTQVQALHHALASIGIRSEMTKEPSDGPFGAIIRTVLQQRTPINVRALALAFAADRADHIDHIVVQERRRSSSAPKIEAHNVGIRAVLDQGIWVICDRYVLSNLAYQTSQDLDLDWLIEINKGILTPDATVLIRTPVAECLRRISYRSSHVELFDDPGQLRSVWERYVRIIHNARKELIGHYVEVDGSPSAQEVTKSMLEELSRYFILDFHPRDKRRAAI